MRRQRRGSWLSSIPDGVGFFYGWLPGDTRRIDVRFERAARHHLEPGAATGWWVAYVAGEPVGSGDTLAAAEVAAIAWMRQWKDLAAR